MIKKLKSAIIAAAVCATFAPASAFAAVQLSYNTMLQATPPLLQPDKRYGSLKFEVSSDGIIHGWYRPQDGGFVPVDGSVKDGKYWLEVGDAGNFQIFATKQPDGTLEGTATNVGVRAGIFPASFDFVARPSAG